MEGALLRSLLELDCLNSLAEERCSFSQEADYMYTPVLSLDDSIELVRKSGLDSPLLCLMGLESPEPEPDAEPEQAEQDSPAMDARDEPSPGSASQDETKPSPEPEAEPEAETQKQSKEDHEEQTPQSPTEVSSILIALQ